VDDANSAALAAMVVGDALGATPLPLQGAVLILMAGCAVWATLRPVGAAAVVAFLACALIWSRANQALEGPILFTLTPEHGITTADLWPPALAGLLGWSRVRSHRATSADGAGSDCVAVARAGRPRPAGHPRDGRRPPESSRSG
jgi:hypothetical protein